MSGSLAIINTVVVGHGLSGRSIHAPLIRRQPAMRLHGFVARNESVRSEARATWNVRGYADVDEAIADPDVDLIVVATPHSTHADLACAILRGGKHCVVDKVMSLRAEDADRMIAARDASGRMLSVFHNRRWDWDFQTIRRELLQRRLGRPLLFENSVCRHSPPRSWRGRAEAAGSILHDWGAHLVDQSLQLGLGPCRRLTAWVIPAPWSGVDSGAHGRIILEFDDVVFQAETSRICRLDRPRWTILGTQGALIKFGVDPQEDALRAGNLDAAEENLAHRAVIRAEVGGNVTDSVVETLRTSWDAYYANIVAVLVEGGRLAVTAEEGREVVRVLEAAERSARDHATVEGPWGILDSQS